MNQLHPVNEGAATSRRSGPVIVPFSRPSSIVTAVRGPVSLAEAPATQGKQATSAEPERSTSEVLSDTIRRWARPTTVEELQSRGVHKVRSISMSRVGALLEKAVNRALIERTLESATDEALTLSATAREQFVRLTRAEATGTKPVEPAEETPLHERATSTLDRLRRELEDRRRVLADREKQLSDGDLDQAEDAKLGNMMRELFAVHAGVDDRLLEREVLGLVLGELRTSRRRARQARLEEHQREIGTLERRITKLSALLGETEDALRRIQAGKKVDPGVSSIYDEVQGLGPEDQQYEQKSELMKCLFEANLALRK